MAADWAADWAANWAANRAEDWAEDRATDWAFTRWLAPVSRSKGRDCQPQGVVLRWQHHAHETGARPLFFGA